MPDEQEMDARDLRKAKDEMRGGMFIAIFCYAMAIVGLEILFDGGAILLFVGACAMIIGGCTIYKYWDHEL